MPAMVYLLGLIIWKKKFRLQDKKSRLVRIELLQAINTEALSQILH